MKKKNILTVVASLATVFASLMATSACMFFFYQPEEPKSLKDM